MEIQHDSTTPSKSYQLWTEMDTHVRSVESFVL